MSRITSGNLLTDNRLCENDRANMSRPWTRATELQSRKVYKLFICVFYMANGLLKKIALAGMVGASAMFGAKEARAASMPWGVSTPATEILTLDDFGYPVNNYSVGRVNITNDADGSSLPSNYAWALIGTANFGGFGYPLYSS